MREFDLFAPRMATEPDDGIKLGTDISEAVLEGIAALAVRDPGVFQRDCSLVHIVRVPATKLEAEQIAGNPQIRSMPLPVLRERLSHYAVWLKYDQRKSAYKASKPSDDVVSAIATRGEWPGIRPLVGILEAPSLRPDGSVIQRSGYDDRTGFVLIPTEPFPHVPERPTQDAARAALAELAEPLQDFPFASDAHRSSTIAAVLTLVARPAIEGSVPGFCFDASTRGSGKTLQSDVVSIIATGRPASRLAYPEDPEEMPKLLASMAVQGERIVAFDNIARPFGGAAIDACLTATDTVALRILGKSEAAKPKWRAVILGTGNNLEFIGDTSRRVLLSRLEPREENPEDRSGFAIPDLRAWVTEHRARLVVAALTLLRAYVIAGRPDVGLKSWGSFEAWSSLIPTAIVWAGGADPMTTRPSADGSVEPEKAALATMLESWPRLAPHGLTAKAAIDALWPAGRPPQGPPDGFGDLREAIEVLTSTSSGRPPNSRQLGKALQKMRRRVVGGKFFDGISSQGGIVKWSVLD